MAGSVAPTAPTGGSFQCSDVCGEPPSLSFTAREFPREFRSCSFPDFFGGVATGSVFLDLFSGLWRNGHDHAVTIPLRVDTNFREFSRPRRLLLARHRCQRYRAKNQDTQQEHTFCFTELNPPDCLVVLELEFLKCISTPSFWA